MSIKTNDDPGSAANFAQAILGNLFPPLASFAAAPILAQALGVDGRGAVAAAIAPLLLVSAIATLGLPEAALHAIARAPRASSWVLARAAIVLTSVGVAATAAVFALSGPLAAEDASIQRNIAIAAVAITPTILMALIRGAAMGLHAWRTITVSRIIESALRLAAVTFLALTGSLTVTSATIVIAIVPVVGGIVLIAPLLRAPRPADRNAPEAALPRLLHFGVRVWLGAVSGVLLARIDQLLMVPLSSAFELGLYAVAVSISELPLVFNSAIREVVFSSDSAGASSRRVGKASRLATMATILAAAPLAITVAWWLPALFGQGFAAAVPATLILLAAAVAGNPGSIAGAGLSARGRPELRSWSLAAAFAVNLGLVFALTPTLGATGAAIATLLGSVAASNLNIYFIWRFFGISPREFYGFRLSDLLEFFEVLKSFLKGKR